MREMGPSGGTRGMLRISLKTVFIYRVKLFYNREGDFSVLWIIESLDNPKDKKFIEELYEDFNRLMFKTARGYVSHLQDQEDIVQSAIEKLIRRTDRLRKISRCGLPSYVVYTVRSVSVDFLRVRNRLVARTVSLDSDLPDWETAGWSELPDMDGYLISEERKGLLRKAIKELPEEDQLLLEGRYVWGLSDKELAEDVGCKPDSVRMKLTRARRKALRYIKEKEGV